MRAPRNLEALAARLGAAPGATIPLAEPDCLRELEILAGTPAGPLGPVHMAAAALVQARLGQEAEASPAALGLALEALAHARRLAARAEALRTPRGPGEELRAAALEAALERAARALGGLPGLVDEDWVDAPLLALGPAEAPALAA
ncbi:MAG TPA: hypothetical protein PK668_18875 [Myxococcota bacterium]|nr:hypothetical protein [Myxococcota bacterium]HRY95206.1 hypothetical protein [Myxococcota bacterium]HSA20519.1 hypothetical protein [Myxococcota bacterium]